MKRAALKKENLCLLLKKEKKRLRKQYENNSIIYYLNPANCFQGRDGGRRGRGGERQVGCEWSEYRWKSRTWRKDEELSERERENANDGVQLAACHSLQGVSCHRAGLLSHSSGLPRAALRRRTGIHARMHAHTQNKRARFSHE